MTGPLSCCVGTVEPVAQVLRVEDVYLRKLRLRGIID
jgi:hypothetical protein